MRLRRTLAASALALGLLAVPTIAHAAAGPADPDEVVVLPMLTDPVLPAEQEPAEVREPSGAMRLEAIVESAGVPLLALAGALVVATAGTVTWLRIRRSAAN